MSKAQRMASLLTPSGKLTIAAIDHRGGLKKVMHPDNPEGTSEVELRAWKKLMVELYQDRVSGLLIDPIYGEELINRNALCGWLMSLEQTGYRGGQQARVTELIPNWSVKRIKQCGAAGVKLLLYYDPDNTALAHKQKELARRIGEECEREGMVYLLEPLSYRVEGQREREVLNIVRDLAELPVDIWKFEYPGSAWACEQITSQVKSPWVLLSAGADYENYKQQLETACQAGASGMAVGRAAWQEMGKYEGSKREEFLRNVAVERIEELGRVVEQYGKPVQNN